MRLAFTCRKCYRRSTLSVTYSSREEAKEVLGDEFMQTRCTYCKHPENKHLNDIYAIADWRVYLIGGTLAGMVGLVLAFFILQLIGILVIFVYLKIALILSAPILFWKWQNAKAHQFNLNRIERHVR